MDIKLSEINRPPSSLEAYSSILGGILKVTQLISPAINTDLTINTSLLSNHLTEISKISFPFYQVFWCRPQRVHPSWQGHRLADCTLASFSPNTECDGCQTFEPLLGRGGRLLWESIMSHILLLGTSC